MAGVLTVKDLLEPLVGDLHDEFDRDDEPDIVRVDGTRWLIDGRTSVDEVRERLGIDLPEGEYVTIGGYLFDGFGHIPTEGERLTVDGWELRVEEMDKRRIAKVLAKHSTPEDERPLEVDGSNGPTPDERRSRGRPEDRPGQPITPGRRLGRPARSTRLTVSAGRTPAHRAVAQFG